MSLTAINKSLAAAFALAASCAGAQTAPAALAPVADVPATMGKASRGGAPFSFCTLPEAAPLAAAQARSSQSFLVGWSIEEMRAPMAKVVAISNLPKGVLPKDACKQVQALPKGGVEAMKLHVPYAVVDKVPDWSAGFTALVMTQKNNDLPAGDYIPRLKRHVRLVTHLFESKGMDGYMVYAGEDFEWAYLHWKDEDTAKRAFATPDGATGPQDSRSIQRPLPRAQIFPAPK